MRSRIDTWIEMQEGIAPRTRGDVEAIQLGKLNRVLERCRERAGFYASLPKRLTSLEQLQSLPFTTEQDIIACGGKMLTVSQSEVARITSDTTSGTTGQAKRLYYSQADRDRTVSFFACGIGEFVSEGDAVLVAMPFSGEDGLGELIAKAVRTLGARPVELGIGKSYGEMLAALEQFRPNAYIGLPVPLLSLLRVAKAWGSDTRHFSQGLRRGGAYIESSRGNGGDIREKRTNVSRETSPFMRARCGHKAAELTEAMPLMRALVSADASASTVTSGTERLLGSRLFPHYGSREIGLGGAITCSAHAGMHIRENDIIAEIIDANGNPVPDGQTGELAVTTIGAEAMPLIRYKTGDRARIVEGICPCGSVIRRLDGVERFWNNDKRLNNVASIVCHPDGTERTSEEAGITALDDLLFAVESLVDYRASKSEGRITIEALVSEETGDDLKAQAQKLFPNCEISLSQKLATPEDKPSYPAKRHWC